MIDITKFEVSADFKTLRLEAVPTSTYTFDLLEIFIGSEYLSLTHVPLTDLITDPSDIAIDITLTNLGLDESGVLDGIFTVHLTDTSIAEIEQGIANLYYVNLCLANMIVANNAVNGWNDINTIYLLNKSITTYLTSGKIEQALNAYERIVAMMENNPKYLVTTDVTPCLIGSGCWIINGTYVIN